MKSTPGSFLAVLVLTGALASLGCASSGGGGGTSKPSPPAGGSEAGDSASGEASGDSASGEAKDGSEPGRPDAGAVPLPGKGSETPEERTRDLDRKLGESLSEFDRTLLREKQVLADKRAGATSGGAGGTTGRAETTGASPSAPMGDETVASSPEGGPDEEGERSRRVPSDIPDSAGDDVVARQLREAAMAEDDPELREKLWDEYRRYKGIGGGKTPKKKGAEKEVEEKEDGGEKKSR